MTGIINKQIVNLEKEQWDVAKAIAAKQSKSIADVVNNALAFQKYLSELPEGALLLVKRPNGTMRKVVFR